MPRKFSFVSARGFGIEEIYRVWNVYDYSRSTEPVGYEVKKHIEYVSSLTALKRVIEDAVEKFEAVRDFSLPHRYSWNSIDELMEKIERAASYRASYRSYSYMVKDSDEEGVFKVVEILDYKGNHVYNLNIFEEEEFSKYIADGVNEDDEDDYPWDYDD